MYRVLRLGLLFTRWRHLSRVFSPTSTITQWIAELSLSSPPLPPPLRSCPYSIYSISVPVFVFVFVFVPILIPSLVPVTVSSFPSLGSGSPLGTTWSNWRRVLRLELEASPSVYRDDAAYRIILPAVKQTEPAAGDAIDPCLPPNVGTPRRISPNGAPPAYDQLLYQGMHAEPASPHVDIARRRRE